MKAILLASAIVVLGGGAAYAQQQGLVNVTIGDIDAANDLGLIEGNTVQVPIGIAAQICGVNANVLAVENNAVDPATCMLEQEDIGAESVSNFLRNSNRGNAPGQTIDQGSQGNAEGQNTQGGQSGGNGANQPSQ